MRRKHVGVGKVWSAMVGVLVLGSAFLCADRNDAPAAGFEKAPEFVFATPAEATAIQRVRRRHGLLSVEPVRLEGSLAWKGAAKGDGWGISLDWPRAYQQRTYPRVHTLVGDAYRTNGNTESAVQEVAKRNIKDAFGVWSVLVLARPHESGFRLTAVGNRTLDGRPLRVYDIDAPPSRLQLLVEADGTIAGISRPWAVNAGQAERLELVRARQRIGTVLVPSEIELIVGNHRGRLTLKGVAGAQVLRDFQ